MRNPDFPNHRPRLAPLPPNWESIGDAAKRVVAVARLLQQAVSGNTPPAPRRQGRRGMAQMSGEIVRQHVVAPSLTVLDRRPLLRNTLRGFATVRIDAWRLVIADIAVHEARSHEGIMRWAQLPAEPILTGITIATGRACPVMTAPKSAEEFEKRLGAALLNGQPLFSLDNINGDLSSDLLCQALEQPRVQIRILGVSKNEDCECRTTWFSTGNNLRIVGDLNRRNLTARLDADTEQPELRKFKTNPVATVMRERGRYIAACLTIVRAYVVAGLPGKKDPLASYREWSDLARSALCWLGCADPVETIVQMRANDPTLEQRRAIFNAWPELGAEYTIAQLVAHVTPVKDEVTYASSGPGRELFGALMSVAPGKAGVVNPTRLGCWFRDNVDRYSDGRKLIRAGFNRTKSAIWTVKAVN